MPNLAYQKGRNYEYRTMRLLEKEGYACFRTAGSHTQIDVLAFLQKEKLEYPVIRAIQCKAMKYISKKDIEELKSFFLPLIVRKEIWHYRLRKEVKIIVC